MEETLVARASIPFRGIPAGGVHGVGLLRAARNGLRLVQGVAAAWQLIGEERPAALLTTGGYVSAPVALAAWLRRIPILVFLPDIEPGLSVKFIARLACKIASTVEDSKAFLPAHKLTATGYPLRQELMHWQRAEARRALGLSPESRVVLVFGGSRGARSLNYAVLGNLPPLLELAEVVHITGNLDWDEAAARRAALPEPQRARYHVYPYLHEEMGAALAAAELVVSRAGASTLGEFPYFGLPAILVPYPYAWRYQKVNADWLAERGAAAILEDARLGAELFPLIQTLLADEARRAAMARAAAALARPDAAQQLATLLRSLGKGG